MIRVRPITNVLGILLIILGALMLTCIIFSLRYEGYDFQGLIRAGTITMGAGAVLSIYRRGNTSINNLAKLYLAMVGRNT